MDATAKTVTAFIQRQGGLGYVCHPGIRAANIRDPAKAALHTALGPGYLPAANSGMTIYDVAARQCSSAGSGSQVMSRTHFFKASASSGRQMPSISPV